MSRILIIKFGALGDVVMASALVEAIVRHHRDASCTLLTTPAFAPLFEAWPDLAVVAFERRGAGHMWRMWRYIRLHGFDRIYDLQGNDRSALLCALSGVRERVGSPARYPYTHHPLERWQGQSHIFTRMRAVLASAGIATVADIPCLPADVQTIERVAAWRGEHRLATRQFVLLHAGASAARPDKRWPYFDVLAERLLGAGLAVVWLGGEAERSLNAQLVLRGGIDATNAFSISELAELGRYAAFALTNDSGPMHVLAASGIAVFGLFGPSDWRRNHALGQAEHVIACRTDAEAATAPLRADCLADLTADTVWARLQQAGVVPE